MKIEIVRTEAKKQYTPSGMTFRTLWHVRVRSRNGRIVVSTETYSSLSHAKRAASWLQRQLRPNSRLVVVDEREV